MVASLLVSRRLFGWLNLAFASSAFFRRISEYSSSKLAPMMVMGSESTMRETIIVSTATTRPQPVTGACSP